MKYRVCVIEWITYVAELEADDECEAEDNARDLWATNAEHQTFKLANKGIDGVLVEPL